MFGRPSTLAPNLGEKANAQAGTGEVIYMAIKRSCIYYKRTESGKGGRMKTPMRLWNCKWDTRKSQEMEKGPTYQNIRELWGERRTRGMGKRTKQYTRKVLRESRNMASASTVVGDWWRACDSGRKSSGTLKEVRCIVPRLIELRGQRALTDTIPIMIMHLQVSAHAFSNSLRPFGMHVEDQILML